MRLRTSRERARLLHLCLLAGYALLVAVAVLWPTPVDAGANSTLQAVLAALHEAGGPRWIDYNLVESGANVLMFVPLGLLAALLMPTGWRSLAPAGAFLLSGAVEWAQREFLPGRYASLQDVWTNTLGAALGTVLAYAWLEFRQNRHR